MKGLLKPARRLNNIEGRRKRDKELQLEKDREFSEFKKEEALKRADEEVKLRKRIN